MIFQQLNQQLNALSNLLTSLNSHQYSYQISHLGNASIGGHTRHIIELLQCAINGYSTGTVDYINRKRDMALETNRLYAQKIINQLKESVRNPDKMLNMLVEDMKNSVESTVTTTYFREIVYNTEHAIHHLALIKVALIELKLKLVDENFGMAYSTIKHKLSLAESN
jgi:hypothetical protein